MKKIKLVSLLFWVAVSLVSCTAASKRKSADYYNQNKTALDNLQKLYEQLYRQQPFSAGFTDKSYKYYTMEVKTDTVRYVYNTEKNKEQVYSMIDRFNYDTMKLKELSAKMKTLQCLWLSKSSFFVNDKKETVTFLSFKSAAVNKPFVENKYYILIFLPHPITSPDIKERIKKGDLVKIDELVYFTIGSKFR
jgi:hypothetical protein